MAKLYNQAPPERPVESIGEISYLQSSNAGQLAAWRSRASLLAGCGALLAITVLWAPIGNTAAYVALFFALLGTALNWSGPYVAELTKQSWLWLLVLGFLLLALSFASNGQYESIADFLFFPLAFIFVSAMNGLRGRVTATGFFWLLLAGAAAAAIVGGYDIYVLGKDRASGLSNSPIHLADFAVILGFMAMGGTLAPKAHNTWPLLAGPILGLVAATLAGTRGAFMVAAVLAVIFALFVFATRPESLRFKAGVVAMVSTGLILIAVLGHLAGYTRPYEILAVLQEMVSGDKVADSSSAYRLEMYRAGLMAFWKAPIFGYGWYNQMAAALPYMSEFGRQGYAIEHWAYLHNDLLGFAVAGGLFGIAAYILWLCAPFVALKQMPNDTYAMVRLYLVTTLIFGLVAGGTTDVLFMTELSKMFLVAMPAAIVALCRTPNSKASPSA